MKKFRFLLPFVVMMAGMASCKKDDVKTETPTVTTGVYVLNEGLLNQNNTTLTYYDFGTAKPVTDYFANVNGKGLGDTGNDLLIYGGKMYIVMNVTSHIRVAEVLTAKSIKEIDFTNGSGPDRKPRNVVAYKNKVLVSSWDNSVSVIDTTTLEVEKVITVGSNPEQMVVSGDKLYVANGGGNSGLDSTVSVVSLTSYTELQKIKVGLNPYCLAADSANNVYVGCNGDYFNVGPKLVKISTITNTVVKSTDTAVGKIRYFDGYLYATGGWLGSPYVRKLNTTDFSQVSANFVTAADVKIQYAYGLDIDVKTGDVWITDAKNFTNTGEVFCFRKDGTLRREFSVSPGLNPNTVAFIRQ